MLDGVAMSVHTQVLAEALDRTVARELLLDGRLVRALRDDEDRRVLDAPRELLGVHFVKAVLLADVLQAPRALVAGQEVPARGQVGRLPVRK